MVGSFAALVASAVGQTDGKAAPKREGGKPVALESLPAPVKLGARVNLIERQFTTIPTVVLVPDEASYLAAIEAWNTSKTSAVRFPVLIDDGTWAGRMRIARFVRAFGPKAVVRWQAAAALGKLPEDEAARRKRIEDAAASAWGVQTAGDLGKRWETLGFAPPGVVVCSIKDGAWTAGVALAAFHGEPVLWVDPPFCPDPNGYLMLEQADDFNARIMKALDGSAWKWKGLGDEIDAVTLCMTTPTRAWLGPTDKRRYFAVTDLVGRTDEKAGRKRWAWCGQIMGSSGQAAYDAMCALFLRPEKAWLFDGYDSSPGWDTFDMTSAGKQLEKIGIVSMVDDAPSGKGLVEWRSRVGGVRVSASRADGGGMGIDAGLVAVNTQGNADFFDLAPARAKPTELSTLVRGTPADVPILRRPAMVYFVHSFSMAQPTNRGTVGAMWRERGAYAYLGSVEEPFLEAFVPTPAAMSRLAAGAPWGVAMRMDGGDIWKIAVLGDPLITFGPQGPRSAESALPLRNTEDVGAKLPDQLRTKDFQGALWTLALTGEDGKASRLLAAALKGEPSVCTPDVALAGIASAFVIGDYPTFLGAASRVMPIMLDQKRVAKEGLAEIRDMVWHAAWPSVPRESAEEHRLLNAYTRPEVSGRDSGEIRKP
jgi:hypothetical protein